MIYNPYSDLSSTHLKALKRLENKKVPSDWIISPDLGKSLWDLSLETGRQLGLLIDRHGSVQCVVVGDSVEIFIPILSRFSAMPGRLRGLRFIRTSLNSVMLDNDDVSDLAILRLDSLSVIHGDDRRLTAIQTVHLLPPRPDMMDEFIPHAIMGNTDPYKSTIDYLDFISALESEIVVKTKSLYEIKRKHAAILVGFFANRMQVGEHMEELSELVDSAGLDVLGMVTQIKQSINPKTVVGSGKLKEIIITALLKGADTIIFDNPLSPAQMKAITEMAEVNVMDRTQVILEIFAQRAVSNEGKIRVELARLRYFLPYLAGSYDNLSRITGGIDGKGPGETKLEIDRRRIAERITFLSNKLKKIEKTRVTQRAKRKRMDVPVISIIGYTNAGKSTLLNTLTQSLVYADDRLFATLDTSSKRIRFPKERDVIITDTVGFIRDLPPDLAGSFKSTLEELEESDIFLHVVDASSMYSIQHIISVNNVLREMGLNDRPIVMVFNKTDLISEEKKELLRADSPDAIFVSALDKSTLQSVVDKLNYELFISGRVDGETI